MLSLSEFFYLSDTFSKKILTNFWLISKFFDYHEIIRTIYYFLMWGDLLIAVISFWFLTKSSYKYRTLAKIQGKLKSTKILNISQALTYLKGKIQKKGTFVMVKGIIKPNADQAQKHIFSVIDVHRIKDHFSLVNAFRRINWQKLVKNPVWKRPWNQKHISFRIKDITTADTIRVYDCANTDISGALTQVYSQTFMKKQQKLMVTVVKTIINFLTNIFPLNFIIPKFKFGQNVSYYAIMEGQFSLVIGKARLNQQGKVVMKNPFFITKQAGYIRKKILWKLSKLRIILALLLAIQIIIGYRFMKWLYFYIRKKIIKKETVNIEQEERDQQEGQNCNCIVCFSNVRNIILKPCRHYGICYQCYRNLRDKVCPVCKQQITGIIRIKKRRPV